MIDVLNLKLRFVTDALKQIFWLRGQVRYPSRLHFFILI